MRTEYPGLPAHLPPELAEPDAGEGLDFQKYWKVIRNHLMGILTLTLSVVGLVYLILLSMTPIYRATATLIIEPQEVKIVSAEELFGSNARQQDYLQTQFEILKSRSLARKLIESLGLTRHPEFSPPPQEVNDPATAMEDDESWLDWRTWLQLKPLEPVHGANNSAPDPMDGLIDRFLARLTVAPVRSTELVKISFDSSDPKLAMRVANAVGSAYIESDMEARSATMRQASSWLASRLDGLRQKVSDSERRLHQFLEKEKLVDVSGVATWSAGQLSDLTGKYIEARKARLELETLYNQLKGLGGYLPENLETVPAVFNDETVRVLKQQENDALAKVNELAGRYGPQHPERTEAEAHLQSVRHALLKQTTSIESGLRHQLSAALTNEMAIRQQVEAVKGDLQAISGKEGELKELQREVQSNRDLYEMFVKRLKETDEVGDLRPPNARILDMAPLPRAPYKPNKTQSILIAFLLALLGGVGLTFLVEFLDKSFRSTEDVEQKLGVPLLGVLPLLKTKAKAKEDILNVYQSEPHSNFAESIRTIRTSILFSNLDNSKRVILVTSSQPNEGKTSLSANMAFCLGQMQRVLVIEGDLRRPSLGRRFGFPPATPGLSEAVAQTAALTDCIRRPEGSTVDILLSGQIPPNPLELLSSQRFSEIIDQLSPLYDTIIIDAPPAGVVSDALALARCASSVIYMVRAGSTPVHVVRSGLQRFRKINAPLTGIVLNWLETEKSGKYGGYYYHESYGYRSADG